MIFWIVAGWVGFCILPWYGVEDGFFAFEWLIDGYPFDEDYAPAAFLILAPFNIFYSAFVHANLNWTLGPSKYVLASPVFHRWHHTHPDEGGSKNFAPTFPVLDIVFGTFYMPKGKLPEHYGVTDKNFPTTHFIDQLFYPFRR